MTKLLLHKHLIIRAEVKNPPKNKALIEKWLSNLVSSINMVELAPARAIYSDMPGNRGMTADVLLNTSNCVIHTWDEVDPGIFMMDLYTCGELDPYMDTIFDLLQVFEPVKIEYMYLDRESGLKILDRGFKQ